MDESRDAGARSAIVTAGFHRKEWKPMRRLPAYLLAALLAAAAAPGVSAQTNYGAGYPNSGAAGSYGSAYGGYPSYSGSNGYSGYSAPSQYGSYGQYGTTGQYGQYG